MTNKTTEHGLDILMGEPPNKPFHIIRVEPKGEDIEIYADNTHRVTYQSMCVPVQFVRLLLPENYKSKHYLAHFSKCAIDYLVRGLWFQQRGEIGSACSAYDKAISDLNHFWEEDPKLGKYLFIDDTINSIAYFRRQSYRDLATELWNSFNKITYSPFLNETQIENIKIIDRKDFFRAIRLSFGESTIPENVKQTLKQFSSYELDLNSSEQNELNAIFRIRLRGGHHILLEN